MPAPLVCYALFWAFRMLLDDGQTLVSDPYKDQAACVADATQVYDVLRKMPECQPYAIANECEQDEK